MIAKQYDLSKTPLENSTFIQQELFEYSTTLTKWAEDVSAIMLRRVAQADKQQWLSMGEVISAQIRKKLNDPTIGGAFRIEQSNQVTLITSIPLEAAKKVHEWTQKSLMTSERHEELAKRIKSELGAQTRARAECIARTETARARTNFTRARAMSIGSTHYVWHTVGDGAVRPLHAKLNGTIQAWNNPPICEMQHGQPVRAHCGCVWNCRCFAEPIISKESK